MKYATICSGIEAPTVAWQPLGWKPIWFSEIEPFPSAALKHHYPEVPNLGDITQITKEQIDNLGPVDLICGGTPCQGFSVAGHRKGMDDPRSQLAIRFLQIVGYLRPVWFVWENVPGVFSSWSDAEEEDYQTNDFDQFLTAVSELGYGWAYRILDAQYFGVPQRRRRIFLVGHIRNWQCAAAVLFERESLYRNPSPSQKERKSVTGAFSARTKSGGEFGTDFDCNGGIISGTIGANHDNIKSDHASVVAGTLKSCSGKSGTPNGAEEVDRLVIAKCLNGKGGSGRICGESETFVTHALRAESFDASEDGTGRGTPTVPVPFDTTQVTSKANYSNPRPGDPCHPLASQQHPPAIAYRTSGNCGVMEQGDRTAALNCNTDQTQQIIAYQCQGTNVGPAGVLRAGNGNETGGVPFVFQTRIVRNGRGQPKSVADALTSSEGGTHADSKPHIAGSFGVRRLTPRECERLMGFPDDYTLIPNQKPLSKVRRAKLDMDYVKYLFRGGVLTFEECMNAAADGPRYKALGNSMAVPVVRWLGQRIEMVNKLIDAKHKHNARKHYHASNS